jgi:hypothetical protein
VWAGAARDWADDGIFWKWARLDMDGNMLGFPYAVLDMGCPSFDLSMGSTGHGLGCTSALRALGYADHWLVWSLTRLSMGCAGHAMNMVLCWHGLCWS